MVRFHGFAIEKMAFFCQKVSVLLREKIAFRGCKLGPKGDVLAVGGREVLLHVKPDEVDDPPGSAQNF